MISLRLSPSIARRFSIGLTVAAALLYAIAPSAAQQQRKPQMRMPILPITPAHPPAPGSPLLAPATTPGPSTLLNIDAWTAIGPAALNNNGFNSVSADVTSGRVTGIAVDPTDSKTIYLAAAGGGVWKTTDGGTTWLPLTDDQPVLAMGSIAIAPSNHLRIYAGTGEANNGGDNNHGAGILVSSDGGATWTLNNASGALTGTAIGQIAVDPTSADIAYAAVGTDGTVNGNNFANEGIYKTTDGGATWTNTTAGLKLPNSTDSTTVDWSSVVLDPNTPTIVYAAIGDLYGGVSNGIYRSTDSGKTWSLLSNAPNGKDTNLGRIALAVSPAANTTGKHVLYIASSNYQAGTNGTYGLGYFLRSDNADATTPTFTDLTKGTPDFLGGENGNAGQGWYDIAVNVDANGVVYASGVENYGAGGTNAIITSSNLGVTWKDISIVNKFEPHTDNHAIAFDSSNRMLAGNDGGIFRYDASTPGWTDLNGNLNTNQFLGISLHPTNPGIVLGGTQDNGTELYTDNLLWTQVAAGDGGPAKIAPSNPLVCYHEYANGYIERSGDGCMTWVPIYTGLMYNSTAFYPPYAVDSGNADHVIYGGDWVNETTDGGNTWTVIGTAGMANFNPNDLNTNSIALSPANGKNPAVVYVAVNTGASSQIFVANPNGTSTNWTEVDLPTCTQNANAGIGCNVNQVVTDPNDPTGQTAFAVVNNFSSGKGGHVFMTTNEGATWTDISAGFPNVPAWSVQIDTDKDKTAYVSTDAGVYTAPSPYSTWSAFGTGLPNAQGYDLELNSKLHILGVGTHGRGAWEIYTSNAQLALSVAIKGPGSGTITSSPTGINCGTTCSATFLAATNVTLTAAPDSTSSLASWSGCDTASGLTCTVSMTGAKSVTATFKSTPKIVTWPTASAITFGQTLAASTLTGGSAVGVDGKTALAGTFAFTNPTTAPAVGVQAESVAFTPTDAADYASITGSVNVNVNLATPTITLTSSANPAQFSQSITLTATLSSSAGIPSGSVTFLDGTTSLGTAKLTAGVATYTTSSLAGGTHSITAQYSGDADFTAITSSVLSQAIITFSISPAAGSPTTLSAAPGGIATFILSVTPPPSGTVTLSVSGLPLGYSTSFSPSTVAGGSAATQVALTINIPAQSAALHSQQRPFGAMPIALGVFLLPLLGWRRVRKSRFLLAVTLALVSLGAVTGLTACSHKISGSTGNPTPAGTYALTVTATDGAQTATTNLTLNVQ